MTTPLIDKITQLCAQTNDTEIQSMLKRIPELYPRIAHGGDDHREWLGTAVDAHFMDEPLPPYAK